MLPYNCTLLCLYIFFQAVLFSFSAPVRLLRFLLQLQVHQWVMTVSVMKFCVQCSGMTSCSCRCLRVHTLSHSMPSRPCMPSHPNEMDDCQGRDQRIGCDIYLQESQPFLVCKKVLKITIPTIFAVWDNAQAKRWTMSSTAFLDWMTGYVLVYNVASREIIIFS